MAGQQKWRWVIHGCSSGWKWLLSLFCNSFGLQVTNTVKNSPQESLAIFPTPFCSHHQNTYLMQQSSCQQILIKKHLLSSSEIAVLSITKVHFQLIIALSHFSPSGCNFPSATGHDSTAGSISSSIHRTQRGDDDIIQDTHCVSAWTFDSVVNCPIFLYVNYKEPTANEITWKT